jgi:O-acetyl-ADP-ribose deacetylase
LGGAVLTSAGRLPFKGIIHVAGINMLWRASEWSIRQSVKNVIALAIDIGFKSIAFPLIGAGSGGFKPERAKAIMEDELGKMDYPMEVRLVVFFECQVSNVGWHALKGRGIRPFPRPFRACHPRSIPTFLI